MIAWVLCSGRLRNTTQLLRLARLAAASEQRRHGPAAGSDSPLRSTNNFQPSRSGGTSDRWRDPARTLVVGDRRNSLVNTGNFRPGAAVLLFPDDQWGTAVLDYRSRDKGDGASLVTLVNDLATMPW